MEMFITNTLMARWYGSAVEHRPINQIAGSIKHDRVW